MILSADIFRSVHVGWFVTFLFAFVLRAVFMVINFIRMTNMKKKLSNLKIGVALLVLVAVCAKVVKAKWFDVQSKLSVFTTNDSNNNSDY